MPEVDVINYVKDLAPASAAVVGVVLICYHLVKMIGTFVERTMKFMDRHIEILDKHSKVISELSTEMRVNGEVISAHTNVIKQVERSLEANTRVIQRLEDRKAI